MVPIQIRPEAAGDVDAIRRLTQDAFAPVAHSSQTEPAIVDALRAAGALALSLVAVREGVLVGHAAFSPVTIDGADRGWFGLGPVSVHPDFQNRGIGGQLIREGLRRLAASGANGCVVLGEPAHYGRFGFASDPALRYEGVPARYFMARSFVPPVPAGRVAYHNGFNAA